jgi:SAM-dependent methyltransferase
MTSLKEAGSHFRFGDNWAEFARVIDADRIAQAARDLARLLGRDTLSGCRFLDLGSGSGLHSLAALRMGARAVVAVDIDAQSVATTRDLLARLAPTATWTADRHSIFEMHPQEFGTFEVVYSWGVLHHTGAMFEAIEKASALVADHGDLCIALYGRTWLCGFWRVEKRLYSRAPDRLQAAARACFMAYYWTLQSLKGLLRGRPFNLRRETEEYRRRRGMSAATDVHDWLGGYPYESVAPDEIRRFMQRLGFAERRSFILPGLRHGLFGSGCDEYVFTRTAAQTPCGIREGLTTEPS